MPTGGAFAHRGSVDGSSIDSTPMQARAAAHDAASATQSRAVLSTFVPGRVDGMVPASAFMQ
jgi:hypothetical protein